MQASFEMGGINNGRKQEKALAKNDEGVRLNFFLQKSYIEIFTVQDVSANMRRAKAN